MQTILIIDDDVKLGNLLSDYFSSFSMKAICAHTPSQGFNLLKTENIDLIVLDIMLPEMDGFEFCKTIRKTSDIPIIMLTARGDVMDRVVGIELGADDYLPKPFEPRELVVRIQSILKRVKHQVTSEVIHFKEITIKKNLRQVLIDGNAINLTGMEFNALLLLAEQPNKIFNRDALLNHLKGIDSELYSRSIDILISRLRAKLKPHRLIKTIRGMGYSFNATPTDKLGNNS